MAERRLLRTGPAKFEARAAAYRHCFGVRVRAGGKRVWLVQFRIGNKQRRITLGPIDVLEPEEAKKRAKAALAKVQLGRDPQAEKLEARISASVTLAVVAARYLDGYAKTRLKPKSFLGVARYLNQHWAPLAEMPVHKIGRADVAARLADIANKNGLFAANRARAALSALYGWAIGEGLVDQNPVVGTRKATEEISRDSTLSEEELRSIWQLAGDGEYGAIIRLLILTGQRREEVGGMLWSELRLPPGMWSIGADRTKNGRPHDVPLSSVALEILNAQPKREERDLVFGAREGAFQGWSRAKEALDRRLLAALKNAHGEKAKLCEGEKAADAAALIFPRSVCSTSPNGSQAAAKADWSPLAGRKVLIWPDADEPGRKYANDVASLLHGQAAEVLIVDAMALASIYPNGGQREPREGWDAVDALAKWPDVSALRKAAHGLARAVEPVAKEAFDRFDSAEGRRFCRNEGAWTEPQPLESSLPPVKPFDAELLPNTVFAASPHPAQAE